MGATITSSNPADFANRIQTYFNPKLMQSLDFNLVLAKLGMTKDYPAIGTTIRFFRPRAASVSGVGALTEGVTPTNKTEVAVGYVDVALAQRGAVASVTDIVQAIDLLQTVQLYVSTMGSDAALDFDTVIRAALIAGVLNSNNTYKYGPTAAAQGYFERFASVVPTGVSANDFAGLAAATVANSKMTRQRHLDMVTQLKAARVPTINGKYQTIVAPAVIHDMRKDTDWLNAAVFQNKNALYGRDTIDLDGCSFVEQDNSFVEKNVYGTYDDSSVPASIFASLYMGAQAFGIPALSNKRAGGSQLGPKINVLAQADKSDPHNQLTIIAWKAFYGCKPFLTNVAGEVPHYGILRTKSTFNN